MNMKTLAFAAALGALAATAAAQIAPSDSDIAGLGRNPIETMAAYTTPLPPGQSYAPGCEHFGCVLAHANDDSARQKTTEEAPDEPAVKAASVDAPAAGPTGPGYADGTDVANALGLSGSGDAGRAAQGAGDMLDAGATDVRRVDGNLKTYEGYTFLGTINAASKLEQYSPDKPGSDFAPRGKTPDVNAETPLTPPLTHVEPNGQ